jgi:hypothetical protein
VWPVWSAVCACSRARADCGCFATTGVLAFIKPLPSLSGVRVRGMSVFEALSQAPRLQVSYIRGLAMPAFPPRELSTSQLGHLPQQTAECVCSLNMPDRVGNKLQKKQYGGSGCDCSRGVEELGGAALLCGQAVRVLRRAV